MPRGKSFLQPQPLRHTFTLSYHQTCMGIEPTAHGYLQDRSYIQATHRSRILLAGFVGLVQIHYILCNVFSICILIRTRWESNPLASYPPGLAHTIHINTHSCTLHTHRSRLQPCLPHSVLVGIWGAAIGVTAIISRHIAEG